MRVPRISVHPPVAVMSQQKTKIPEPEQLNGSQSAVLGAVHQPVQDASEVSSNGNTVCWSQRRVAHEPAQEDSAPRSPRCSAAKIRRQQAELLEWIRLGAGVWLSAILSDVYLTHVEDWLKEGKANPDGRYGTFAREFSALTPSLPDVSLNGKLASLRVRIAQNGNASSNGNGQHSNGEQILRIQDL
jgi:hypothetical protein